MCIKIKKGELEKKIWSTHIPKFSKDTLDCCLLRRNLFNVSKQFIRINQAPLLLLHHGGVLASSCLLLSVSSRAVLTHEYKYSAASTADAIYSTVSSSRPRVWRRTTLSCFSHSNNTINYLLYISILPTHRHCLFR